jgi:hypothetical protein
MAARNNTWTLQDSLPAEGNGTPVAVWLHASPFAALPCYLPFLTAYRPRSIAMIDSTTAPQRGLQKRELSVNP